MNKIISNCPICEERALHVLQDKDKQLDNQQCISCGYVTSHLFKMDDKPKEENQKYNTLTDEMKFWSKEANGRIWIPTIMTLPLGMLYPINKDDEMKWAFAEMVKISEEEQKKYPIPNEDGKFYAQRYDTDNMKIYDEFLYALAELNERIKNENQMGEG